MTDTGDYSEVSQLRTRCTILESQIQVLEKQNSELKHKLAHIHPDTITSTEKNITYKDVPNVGKFPVDYSTLGPDDGSFQV